MTAAEMHEHVMMLLDKINSYQADTLLANEIDLALNMAQLAFVKNRFQRYNKFGAGFEESQKRIDDLAPLIRTTTISLYELPYNQGNFATEAGGGLLADAFPNASQLVLTGDKRMWRDVYRISMNEDIANTGNNLLGTDRVSPYMFLISARARVNYINCKKDLEEGVDYSLTDVDGDGVVARRSQETLTGFGTSLKNKVVKCKYVQNDDLFTLFEDPFNTTTLNTPFYSFSGANEVIFGDLQSGITNLEIYTDDTFFTDAIFIRYIKRPNFITINQTDCELSPHVHIEVVNMAVDILLEGTSDPRYKSHQTETLKSD